jgi:hypothetical protein
LYLANFRGVRFWDGQKNIELAPGEFITSRKKLAEFARVSEKEVRAALSALKSHGYVDFQSHNGRYTLIRVSDIAEDEFSRASSGPGDIPRAIQVEGQVEQSANHRTESLSETEGNNLVQVEGQLRARLVPMSGPQYKKEKIELKKEEEPGDAAADSSSPPPADPEAAARAYVEARYLEFAAAYPGGGGRPRTLDEAVQAYLCDKAETGVALAEWWPLVLARVRAYREALRRGVVAGPARDAPFFFLDGLHRKTWPGVPAPGGVTVEAPRDLQLDAEGAALVASGSEVEGIGPAAPSDPSPAPAPPPATAPATASTARPCFRCCSTGEIPRDNVTLEELEAGAGYVPCPTCQPAAYADRQLRELPAPSPPPAPPPATRPPAPANGYGGLQPLAMHLPKIRPN